MGTDKRKTTTTTTPKTKAYKDISLGNKTSPVIRSSHLIGVFALPVLYLCLEHWMNLSGQFKEIRSLWERGEWFSCSWSLSLSLSLGHQMVERGEKVEECGIPVEVSMHIFDEYDDKSLLISPEKKEKGVRGVFFIDGLVCMDFSLSFFMMKIVFVSYIDISHQIQTRTLL